MRRRAIGPVSATALLASSLTLTQALPQPALAADDDAASRIHYNLRYRLERVDEDGFDEDARASTVRLRLGYTSATLFGLFAAAEFEAVAAIGDDRFNSTANGRTQFPVVADPDDEEVNQAYVGWTGAGDTTVKFGRQRVVLDNHRFIGNVGWRQNEQTYDALSVRSAPVERLELFYAKLNNANRIFGEHHPQTALSDLDLNADLLNGSYRFPIGKLTAYGYRIELEESPALSHRNVGVRFSGEQKLSDDVKLIYTGEVADQTGVEGAPASVDADYGLAELGLGIHGVVLRAGLEVLGGDGTYAFQTPLATLHAHNGWTDRFTTTPLGGLEDFWYAVSGKHAGFRWLVIRHEFTPEADGADYGSELGFRVQRSLGKRIGLDLKYASFEAETPGGDVDKLWFAVTISGPSP